LSAARSRSGARVRPTRLALALIAAVLVLVVALTLAGRLPGSQPTAAVALAGQPDALPQTDAALPARRVTMVGATPEEPGAPGGAETWGVGLEGSTNVLVRYTSGSGWSLGPTLPAGFKMAPSQFAGTMSAHGAGTLIGTIGSAQALLVRDPGGAFEETTTLVEGEPLKAGEEPLLKKGEALFASNEAGGYGLARAPMIAALDEPGESAGALVAPAVSSGVESQVLHWSGGKWSSEPIAIPAESAGEFRVLAIAAGSTGNAWLLAQLAAGPFPAGSVALFRRVQEGAAWQWKPVQLGAGAGDGKAHPLTVPLQGGSPAPFTVAGSGEPPTVRAQLLTVTGEGVWVDGERADIHSGTPSATLFFKPEGAAGGQVEQAWCTPPPGGEAKCAGDLPEALPSAFTRSFAWSGGEHFGARVISGLPEGVSLRFEHEQFHRVLALGGGGSPEDNPGSALGAAFSSPSEGWLGLAGVPVHLSTALAGSSLASWPVPFRHPLLAIAPQPGVPVGALSSEALAVGERGAVARYKPSEGWQPESLLGPGGRVETPRLRGVAWPTPMRAYAVGDEGAMWLWRGETGLWERDPAAPLNFRGDLLGIAFDPNNPGRGYAVGSTVVGLGGVLLRYGKSWTQESELPAQAQGAAFVSIAFAGSQAIVAYRKQAGSGESHLIGGLMLNDGSGWRIDQEAAAVSGGAVPQSVAALPDGGAAFVTTGGPEGARVYERESAGAPWKATTTPLPPANAGSVAVFREGGALRAVVTGGGGAGSSQIELEQPPPGTPPNYHGPLTPIAGLESGDAMRQTGSGWSDEDHELNSVGAGPGGYVRQDLPKRPDSVLAMLVSPSGGQGWAVGGNLNEEEERLQTADVWSYGPERAAALTFHESTVPLVRAAQTGGTAAQRASYSTFAVGGHAECVAPCGNRALAGVGPQVWLQAAVNVAHRVGVQEFFYTGPSVTEAQVTGHRTLAIPFASELQRTSSILASGSPVEAFASIAAPDLDARPEREGTELSFELAFTGFPQELFAAGERSQEECAGAIGCQRAYYSFRSRAGGGPVRMIILDESTPEASSGQLKFLEAELANARSEGLPAIAIGSADLSAEIAAGNRRAAEVAQMLVKGSLTKTVCTPGSPCNSASAYFYDAPEENVQKPLRAGGDQIPSFGSGTLGYVNVHNELRGNFHGASGILLAQVQTSTREETNNRAPVSARLIPVIGELAMEAKQGTLLRRSQPAVFAGLARRPRAGCRAAATGTSAPCEVDPYIPIPSICVGECGTVLPPEYEFSSSNPEVGGFVKRNTALSDPLAVTQENGQPVREEADAQSGLFCAYNPGTTIVTISAGGWSASLPVTVQAGSVRQPCGTVPLKERPANEIQAAAPPPPPPTQPSPTGSAPTTAPLQIPLPAAPSLSAPVTAHPAAALQPFVPLAAPPSPLLAFVPPPVPTPARPTPPSGTSAVTSPIEVAEKEEEEEEATESVSNQAVAYRSSEHEPTPAYILGVVLLAALAGAGIGRSRRGRRQVRVAPATVSGSRRQRSYSASDRPRR
jgi:hypothetical protein